MSKIEFKKTIDDNETLTYEKSFSLDGLGEREKYRRYIQVDEVFTYESQSIHLFIDAELMEELPCDAVCYDEHGVDANFTYSFSVWGRHYKVVKYTRMNGDGIFLYEWSNAADVGNEKKANVYTTDYDCWGNLVGDTVWLRTETGDTIRLSSFL